MCFSLLIKKVNSLLFKLCFIFYKKMSIADTNENSGYIFTLSLHLSLCYSQRLQTDTLKQNGHINISSTLNAHTFQEKNILKFKVKTTL